SPDWVHKTRQTGTFSGFSSSVTSARNGGDHKGRPYIMLTRACAGTNPLSSLSRCSMPFRLASGSESRPFDSALRCASPTILQGDYEIRRFVRQAYEIITLF